MNPDYMHCKPSTGEELKVKILTSKVDKLLEIASRAKSQQLDIEGMLVRINSSQVNETKGCYQQNPKVESFTVVEKLSDLEDILYSIIDSSSANISRLNDLV